MVLLQLGFSSALRFVRSLGNITTVFQFDQSQEARFDDFLALVPEVDKTCSTDEVANNIDNVLINFNEQYH